MNGSIEFDSVSKPIASNSAKPGLHTRAHFSFTPMKRKCSEVSVPLPLFQTQMLNDSTPTCSV